MIKKKNIPDLIINQIKNKIKSGEIKPGEKLPTKGEMAKKLNVGKNSLRETLSALEYLEIIKNTKDGYKINENLYEFHNKSLHLYSKLEKKKMNDLFKVRKIIESKSIKLVTDRLTYKAQNKIEKYLKKCEKHAEDPQTYIRANKMFHLEIIKTADNKLLLSIYHKINDLILLEDNIKNIEEIIPVSLKFHRKIYRGIINNEPEIATKYILKHLNHVYNN